MDALLRPVVSASADTAIYQRVDSAWLFTALLVGVGHRRVRQAVLRGVPTDLHDRTSEDGSVEARSKRGQMQLGRPAAPGSFGRHLNFNACAFRQAIYCGDAIPARLEQDFLCQRRCGDMSPRFCHYLSWLVSHLSFFKWARSPHVWTRPNAMR